MEIAALMLGFVGGLHCVGMCGPLVLALPKNAAHSRWQYWLGRLTYNSGRVVTYALMGAVAGAVGQVVSLAGYQTVLSLVLGTLLILSFFLPFSRIGLGISNSTIWKKSLGALFRKKSFSALAGIGLLNGFLPCGLVYAALAGAAGTGTILSGVIFMTLFGIATAPALLAVAMVNRIKRFDHTRLVRKALPAAALILGFLLVLRGLNLGIPYISPDLEAMPMMNSSETEMQCH